MLGIKSNAQAAMDARAGATHGAVSEGLEGILKFKFTLTPVILSKVKLYLA